MTVRMMANRGRRNVILWEMLFGKPQETIERIQLNRLGLIRITE